MAPKNEKNDSSQDDEDDEDDDDKRDAETLSSRPLLAVPLSIFSQISLRCLVSNSPNQRRSIFSPIINNILPLGDGPASTI